MKKECLRKAASLSLSFSLIFLLLNSCATNPSRINAEYVSPHKYKKMTCEEVLSEQEMINNETRNLTASMNKKRSNDTALTVVGTLIFWPAFFFLNGKDVADNMRLSELKGEKKAINRGIASCKKRGHAKEDTSAKRSQEVQPIIINNKNN